MRIGFIGLGNLGKAIVERLLDCGYDPIVWNRTTAKMSDSNCRKAASLSELADNSDVICLCLFDSDAVTEVLFGDSSLSAANLKQKLVIDFTSHDSESVVDIHKRCHQIDIAYLEAPVFGSVVPAKKGEVTIVASGIESAYDKALPFLKQVGGHIFYLPQPGMATKMKLVNNLVLGTFMAAIVEAVALGEAAGLKREELLDILEVGAGKSGVLSAKKKKLIEDDFSPHFSCSAIQKDMSNAEALARQSDLSVETGKAANQLFLCMVEKGEGELDLSAIIKSLKK